MKEERDRNPKPTTVTVRFPAEGENRLELTEADRHDNGWQMVRAKGQAV